MVIFSKYYSFLVYLTNDNNMIAFGKVLPKHLGVMTVPLYFL